MENDLEALHQSIVKNLKDIENTLDEMRCEYSKWGDTKNLMYAETLLESKRELEESYRQLNLIASTIIQQTLR